MKTTPLVLIALLSLPATQAYSAAIKPSQPALDATDCSMSYNGSEQHITIGDINYKDPVSKLGQDGFDNFETQCTDHYAQLSSAAAK